MKSFILIIAIVVSVNSFGQKNTTYSKELYLMVGVFNSPVIYSNVTGGSFEFRLDVFNRFSTGVATNFGSKKVDYSFQYEIENPSMNFTTFLWRNQYAIFKNDLFNLGVALDNGVGISQFCDRDQLVTTGTRYGIVKTPKKIVGENFYVFQPSLNMSFRLFKFNSIDSEQLNLVLRGGYRFTAGNMKYASPSDFNNYFAEVGLAITGAKPTENE